MINQEPVQAKDTETESIVREEKEKDDKAKKNKKGGKDEKEEKEKKGNKQNKAQDKEKGKKNVRKLKDVLFKLLPCFHQGLIDQLLKDKNLNPNNKAGNEHINILQEITNESIEFLKSFSQQKQKGYLSYKAIKPEEGQENKENEIIKVNKEQEKPEKQENEAQNQANKTEEFVKYLEFSPIPLKTNENIKELESFDKAVDEFFTKQQLPDAQKTKEDKKKIAWKKYENIKVRNFNIRKLIAFFSTIKKSV